MCLQKIQALVKTALKVDGLESCSQVAGGHTCRLYISYIALAIMHTHWRRQYVPPLPPGSLVAPGLILAAPWLLEYSPLCIAK